MSRPLSHQLSRRERQIMDAIYTLGEATAAQVQAVLPGAAGLSSVRKLILILEQRGHLRHRRESKHFVYAPTQPRHSAARSAVRQMLSTFFGGNAEAALVTLLSEADLTLSDEQVERLRALVEQSNAGDALDDEGRP